MKILVVVAALRGAASPCALALLLFEAFEAPPIQLSREARVIAVILLLISVTVGEFARGVH